MDVQAVSDWSWADDTRPPELWGEAVFVFPETPGEVRDYLESLPPPPHPTPGNPLRRGGLWAVETRGDRWECSEDAGEVVAGLLD